MKLHNLFEEYDAEETEFNVMLLSKKLEANGFTKFIPQNHNSVTITDVLFFKSPTFIEYGTLPEDEQDPLYQFKVTCQIEAGETSNPKNRTYYDLEMHIDVADDTVFMPSLALPIKLDTEHNNSGTLSKEVLDPQKALDFVNKMISAYKINILGKHKKVS